MAGAQINNRLPDGRQIRALKGTFTQRQMFTLHTSGLFVPANESIMTVKEHDQSIQSGAYRSVSVNGWWRTGEYAFYPRGFERADIPIGDRIVYVEGGVFRILEIPDVPVSVNGKTISLRTAIGTGVIPLEKLGIRQVDETHFIVSVTTDFNPATDVEVVDIMRPRGWALTDANGYPLRMWSSGYGIPEARYMYVRHSTDFDTNSTGYHGSLARGVNGFYDGRGVDALTGWFNVSGVALVGRDADVAKIESLLGAPVPAQTAAKTVIQLLLSAQELVDLHIEATGAMYRLTGMVDAQILAPIRRLLDIIGKARF